MATRTQRHAVALFKRQAHVVCTLHNVVYLGGLGRGVVLLAIHAQRILSQGGQAELAPESVTGEPSLTNLVVFTNGAMMCGLEF